MSGMIINGRFISSKTTAPVKLSSQYKSWDHSQQRLEHRKDLIQPWRADGTPNPQFVRAYPEHSRQYYTPEQINKYINEE